MMLKSAVMRKNDIIYPNIMFLTHKECENHLRKYGYNYSEDAHAYAMTAYRSPEVETLLNILETVIGILSISKIKFAYFNR